jgi:hypothetical protein
LAQLSAAAVMPRLNVQLQPVGAAQAVRTGPVQHVDTQIIQSQADADAMAMALSFKMSQGIPYRPSNISRRW